MLVLGQNIVVSGKVTDVADGVGIPGVNIIVKGTTMGTTTDLDGNYSLTVSSNATLVFSFIGYTGQEIAVNNQTTINVSMVLDLQALEEVITIGYGTTRKEDATGSVTAISTDDFNRGAITSPQELVTGKIAGVQITNSGGAPGAGATIRIRGGSSLSASNDPLIVIDGVPVDNDGISGMRNPLNTIHPNDIATFTILKDASATAIYGSRASNGVIIIETKKGKKDLPFKINYDANLSIGMRTGEHDVLSAKQFEEVIMEQFATNPNATSLLGTANTNWQDEIYQTSIGHDHNLSFSGSAMDIPYRVSIGYSDQSGILKTSGLDRFTGAINLNPSFLDDHLRVNLNVKGMNIRNQFANTGAVGAAAAFDPTQPVKDPSSPYGGYYTWTNDVTGNPIPIATSNPVALLEMRDDKSTVNRSIGNLQLEYKVHWLPELKAKLNLGYDISESNGKVLIDEDAAWTFDETYGGGERTIYTQNKKNELLDFYFNYVKNLGSVDSRIDATAGYSWQHFYRKGTNFSTNRIIWKVFDNSDYETESYLVSFFGRVNYVFKDRYLLTVTVREDGSSRFSPDTRWGLFPSAAFAWDIGDESFINPELFSTLKLRLGWGITGQQNISNNDYPYLAAYTASEDNAQYQFGSTFYNTLRPEGYDANLKWEETTTYNVGLDFGIMKNRITGALDYYYRVTDDLINFIPVPAGTNLTNQILTNVGDLYNTGIEFTINAKPISKTDMYWEVGFNATYNKNEITKLTLYEDPTYIGVPTGGISGGVGNNIQVHTVGYPAYSFFVYQQVYDESGDPIEGLYVDRNGDGVLSVDDKYRYKKATPDVYLGFSSFFQYKNFDFSFAGRVNIGNYIYNNQYSSNGTYSGLYNSVGYLNNSTTSLLDTKFSNPRYFSDYYMENGSFLRLDNMTLGYNFKNLQGGNLGLRLYASVQNVFVITKYQGLDPEVGNGVDNNLFPRPRTFMLGLSLEY